MPSRPTTRPPQARRLSSRPPTFLQRFSRNAFFSAARVRRSSSATAVAFLPGFAQLRAKARRNPAEVLLTALNAANLDNRVTEGLPWLALAYADMDWDWVVQNAKLLDRQNRLGFVVTLASQLASKTSEPHRSGRLREYLGVLERSRLVKEDTLCHDSLTEAERKWLRSNRPAEAAHWNLLTDMKAENLPHATL